MLERYGEGINFYQFVEHSLNAVFIIGKEGIVYTNQKLIDLLEIHNKEELLGKSFYNYIHPDYHQGCKENLKRVVDDKEIVGVEEQKWIKSNGVILDVEVLATPFEMPNGEILAQGIANDISSRKRVERQIMQSEKLSLIGELAAGIVHEIRNPLTSINGFLQIVKAEFDNHHYFDIMQTELGYIEKIASELLFLSRPEKEYFKQECLYQILQDVIFLLKHQAIKKEVELILKEIENHNILINGDSTKLKQVFINLIKNAIEASFVGGMITIDIKKSRDDVSIRITDNGCGIPKEKQSKIGDSFFTTKEEGTGLGLMITFLIVQKHKGNIFFESEEGKGTTFIVNLPIESP